MRLAPAVDVAQVRCLAVPYLAQARWEAAAELLPQLSLDTMVLSTAMAPPERQVLEPLQSPASAAPLASSRQQRHSSSLQQRGEVPPRRSVSRAGARSAQMAGNELTAGRVRQQRQLKDSPPVPSPPFEETRCRLQKRLEILSSQQSPGPEARGSASQLHQEAARHASSPQPPLRRTQELGNQHQPCSCLREHRHHAAAVRHARLEMVKHVLFGHYLSVAAAIPAVGRWRTSETACRMTCLSVVPRMPWLTDESARHRRRPSRMLLAMWEAMCSSCLL